MTDDSTLPVTPESASTSSENLSDKSFETLAEEVLAEEAHAQEIYAKEALAAISPEILEQLSSQLVWRIGRLHDDEPVTVRLGFAGATHHFNDLPRLKNVSDDDIEKAMKAGEIHVEWVGHRA